MNTNTLRSLFVVLFAVAIAAGALVSIPFGNSTLTVQNMIVLLASCVMGSIQGAASTGLFLAAGALGLPVFTGGQSGVACLTGSDGGFLIGLFLGALVCGFIVKTPSESEKKTTLKLIMMIIIAFAAGDAVFYLSGTFYFMYQTGNDFMTTLSLKVFPFLPGEIFKLVLTTLLSLALRPAAARYLYSDSAAFEDSQHDNTLKL